MLEVRVLPRQPCSFVTLVVARNPNRTRAEPDPTRTVQYKPVISYGADVAPERLILCTAMACIKYQSFFRRAA